MPCCHLAITKKENVLSIFREYESKLNKLLTCITSKNSPHWLRRKVNPIEFFAKTTKPKILHFTAVSEPLLEHRIFQLCKCENFIILQLTETNSHMLMLRTSFYSQSILLANCKIRNYSMNKNISDSGFYLRALKFLYWHIPNTIRSYFSFELRTTKYWIPCENVHKMSGIKRNLPMLFL